MSDHFAAGVVEVANTRIFANFRKKNMKWRSWDYQVSRER
jgi:hypothetical protein